jgi:hypothetical protein
MDKKTAKKAKELLRKIDEFSEYKKILESRRHHFQLVEHYGHNPLTIILDEKYNPEFIAITDKIISDLENELSNL